MANANAGFDVQAARYCARLAVSQFKQAGVELPQQLQDHLRQLEDVRSSTVGTENQSDTEQSDHDLIGAEEAANILGCSARYVRRIVTDLDGRHLAGRWLFNRHNVIEYAKAKAERT